MARYNLYTQFDNNDWGDEDPNDPSINDPNNVTPRSKVSKTIKSDLFGRLNVDLLDKYSDLLKDYFTGDSMNNLKNQFYKIENNETEDHPYKSNNENAPENVIEHEVTEDTESIDENLAIPSQSENNDSKLVNFTSNNQIVIGNSTSHGEDKKAYELNETEGGSVAKQANLDVTIFIVIFAITLILLAIGYRREKKNSK